MAIEIKFRQPLLNLGGEFKEWFYWGFIDNTFVSPALSLNNGVNTRNIAQQFIGLKDRNGIDIYNGDVLKVKGRKRIGEYVTTVEHRKSGFYLKRNDTYFNDDAAINRSVEVIGNIYENPELVPNVTL